MAALFTATLTGDGNTAGFRLPGPAFTVAIVGDFGSGTATVQFSTDGSTWQSITDATLTAAGQKVIDLGSLAPDHTYQGRVNLAGSSSPDIDIEVL